MADPAIAGTPINEYHIAATSHTVNLPTGILATEIIVVECYVGDGTKWASSSGYTAIVQDVGPAQRVYLYKQGTGSDPASITVNIETSGSSDMQALSYRLENVDTADPFNSDNLAWGTTADTSTPSIAADSITVGNGNGVLFSLSCEAVRTVTTPDGDLTLISSYAADGNSVHSYIDPAVSGTGNPEYAFTMSSNRAYEWTMLELNPAAGGSITREVPNGPVW